VEIKKVAEIKKAVEIKKVEIKKDGAILFNFRPF